MTNNDITSLGWTELREVYENYYSLKDFLGDDTFQEGFEYRLSIFPDSVTIEVFPINYGISAAEDQSNYDCNGIFKGKIDTKEDLKILMGWLEIPVKEIINQ